MADMAQILRRQRGAPHPGRSAGISTEASPLEESERAQLALELGELGLEHALLSEHLVIGVGLGLGLGLGAPGHRGRSKG